MKTESILHLAAVAAMLLSPCVMPRAFAQGGSLTPPGAPAPTMKTLDQLEPRTPISSLPFTISASGSYYLTGNFLVTTGDAITIGADDVTLDLNGFTVSSTANPASGAGVLIAGQRRNVTVKNGHIKGTTIFSAGVFTTGGFLDGIDNGNLNSVNLRFFDISVLGVADAGINTVISSPAGRYLIDRCSVEVCGGIGMRAATVSSSRVVTAGGTGIIGEVVTNCAAQSVGTTTATTESAAGRSWRTAGGPPMRALESLGTTRR